MSAYDDGAAVGHRVAAGQLDPSDATDDGSYVRALHTGLRADWWDGFRYARENFQPEVDL